MKTINVLRNTLIVVGAVLVPSVLLAGNYTLKYQFSPGTPILSTDVNDNFNALLNGLNTHNHFGDPSWTGSSPTYGLSISNQNASGGSGLYAENNAPFTGSYDWAGVHGHSKAVSSGVGVLGDSDSTTGGIGVFGLGNNIGVEGWTQTPGGIAVQANYQGNKGAGVALQVVGAIQVTGNTPAAFVETNQAVQSCHYFSNPLTDGDPNAILIVTPNYSSVSFSSPVGVQYNGNIWGICRGDGQNIPVNAQFNVLVIKTG